MTIVDPKRFTAKNKLITYTRAFVELCKWKNRGQVYKIHEMIELDKWHVSMAENLRNLSAHHIIEVSSDLRSAYVISRDQDRIIFYVNNYIDWDQFK